MPRRAQHDRRIRSGHQPNLPNNKIDLPGMYIWKHSSLANAVGGFVSEAKLWREKAEMWRSLAKTTRDAQTVELLSILADEAEVSATESEQSSSGSEGSL
jgi:hypothetical protein